MSQPISEDAIKRAVVPFLKNFYKYRYAVDYGTEKAEFDLTDGEGHVVDGRLSFQKEKGQPFVCAFEATSVDKLEEVRFTLNRPYFLWDCGAWASLTVAALLVFLTVFRLAWLHQMGWQGIIGLVFGVGCMAFLTFFFLLKTRRKYRYIYAVEQFKTYAADEQWVALAENAFPNSTDKFLMELRNQLIFNGFGLLFVRDDGSTRAVITPSRLGQFGSTRKFHDFFTRQDFVKKTARRVPKKPLTLVGKGLQKLWSLVQADRLADSTTRYMKSFFHQKMLATMGLAVIGLMVWRARSYRTIDYPNEMAYRAAILKQAAAEEDPTFLKGDLVLFKKKPESYLTDSLPSEPDLSVLPEKNTADDEENVIHLSDDAEEKNVIHLSDDAPEPRTEKQPVLPEKTIKTQSANKPSAIKNSCEKWAALTGFVVQDNSFSDLNFANARLAELREKSVACQLVRRTCLNEKWGAGWVVLLGEVFQKEAAARSAAASFQKNLKSKGIEKGFPMVKKLR